jgi:RimJ/RimL family protein N-acetyltransferase
MAKAVPIICGEKVWLRAMEHDDLDAWYAAANNAEIGYVGGIPFPMSRPAVEQWYQKTMTEKHGHDGFYFTICSLADDRLLGFTWLHQLDLMAGSAEYSIVLATTECLGQGYGTDATRAVLDFGFGELQLERIQLRTNVTNRRAIHCYEKAGFVIEGTLRHIHRKRGQMIDEVIMSILREEWAAKRAETAPADVQRS